MNEDQAERLLREMAKAWTTLHDDLQMIACELHTLNSSTPISEWHRKNK